MNYPELALIAFVLSIIFSIGGVGSAIAIVPVMGWLGVPLMTAKPAGLFINTLSMLSATVKNIKAGKLDHRFGLPILIVATVMAPLGAYAGKFIPHRIVLVIFVAFLLYSGTMMLFFRPKARKGGNHVVEGSLIGGIAGFLGGLLGVGGGGIISPALILLGYEPKKVASTTALVVFFSSLSGFLTYWRMGALNWELLLWVSIPAIAGGWLGTHLMHFRMSSEQVKKVIGVIMYLIALKTLLVALGL
ncbi:sulfite exporter TauE/SafE family protein [Thermococcus sp. MV11]|uniref:sulfite exporter TauE/SafE family protein n=1 Tax=Thermococcus sp. MV11 TaxID=1638267 RepID=UPI00142F965D|nr:sulfite exporter TauE/SafE family protein [Thermococcus sp. MV11]NJE03511.1 sulfite exporter TauE/SafE family protein [Thermococcus sp. MV11]